jgi:hypothetical protein
MSSGFGLLVLAGIAAVAINKLSSTGILGTRGVYAAAAIIAAALAWGAWEMGELPFLDAARRRMLAKRMAKKLNGSVSSKEQNIWGGGTATSYTVQWDRTSGRFELEFDVGGTTLRGNSRGARDVRFAISVDEDRFEITGDEAKLAEQLLDNPTRAALTAIDRLDKSRSSLSLHTGGGSAYLYKQQLLSAHKTADLVVLGTPVIERAAGLTDDSRQG